MRHLLATGFLGLTLVAAKTSAALSALVGDVSAGPETKGVIDVVLQHGITGAMLLIVLYGYYKKDVQAREESAARIADTKAYGEAMRLQVVATTTQMERFNDTAEALVNELRNERRQPPRQGSPR